MEVIDFLPVLVLQVLSSLVELFAARFEFVRMGLLQAFDLVFEALDLSLFILGL